MRDPNWYWDKTVRMGTYAWHVDPVTGRVVRVNPEDSAVEVKIDELKETAELLASVTPADTAEMADVCAEIHAALDLQDEIQAAETKACAKLKAELEALRTPFKTQLDACAGVIAAAKGALIRRIDADEAEALAAIKAGSDVPAPRELPKGLSVRRTTVLDSVDMVQLPEKYHAIIADTDAILSAAEAGLEVPGAVVEIKTGVVFRRPTKK